MMSALAGHEPFGASLQKRGNIVTFPQCTRGQRDMGLFLCGAGCSRGRALAGPSFSVGFNGPHPVPWMRFAFSFTFRQARLRLYLPYTVHKCHVSRHHVERSFVRWKNYCNRHTHRASHYRLAVRRAVLATRQVVHSSRSGRTTITREGEGRRRIRPSFETTIISLSLHHAPDQLTSCRIWTTR